MQTENGLAPAGWSISLQQRTLTAPFATAPPAGIAAVSGQEPHAMTMRKHYRKQPPGNRRWLVRRRVAGISGNRSTLRSWLAATRLLKGAALNAEC
jgi:hypothetical protein